MRKLFEEFGFVYRNDVENQVFTYSMDLPKGTYKNGYKESIVYLVHRPKYNNSIQINLRTKTSTMIYTDTDVYKANDNDFVGYLFDNQSKNKEFLKILFESLEIL